MKSDMPKDLIWSDDSTLCATSAFSASCMLKHAIITLCLQLWQIVLQRSAKGCNRPIASWRYEPVAERWSLHPFSLNPNSCSAP